MKKVFSIMCFLLLSYTVMAQKADEVTLVASGSASTEQEATLVALRSAIEQTFGTFVSSNTTMVNDELIKDEIVSISNGNVKNYEKLSSNVLSNGHVSVSVKATICISKLISYAKSKGSSAEFAGQTFAMNIKLKELREKNTITAIKHMVDECIILAKDAFDFQVKLGEPRVDKSETYLLKLDYISPGGRVEYDCINDDKSEIVEGYFIPVYIELLANSASSHIYDLFINTMNSLKLSDEEVEEYKKIGVRFSHWLAFSDYNKFRYDYNLPISDYEVLDHEIIRLRKSLTASAFGYKLIDTSNPQNNFKWYKQLRANTRVLTESSSLGEPYHEYFEFNQKTDTNWFLIDSRNILNASVLGQSNGTINFYEYRCYRWLPNKSKNYLLTWFDNGLFEKFQLPKSNKTESLIQYSKKQNKKKRNKKNSTDNGNVEIGVKNETALDSQKAVSNDEQRLILTFGTSIFIQRDSMENFNGLTLERQ